MFKKTFFAAATFLFLIPISFSTPADQPQAEPEQQEEISPEDKAEGIKILKQLAHAYYFDIQDYDKAEQAYEHLYNLVETSRDKALYLHWVAMSLHAQGKFSQALVKSEALIENYPNITGITDHGYALKGHSLRRLYRYDEAISSYQDMLENCPQSHLKSKIWLETGRCHYFMRRYQQAIEAFQKVGAGKFKAQAEENIKTITRLFKDKLGESKTEAGVKTIE
jgi:tetratricopeptide (TPR) repeat protein